MENYIELILNDKIYTQRTPNSKFIEFNLNGVKQKTHEELPEKIKEIIEHIQKMEEMPDNYFIYTQNNNEIEIKSIKPKTLKYIKIPELINGLPVTKIGKNAFVGCEYFTEQIQLPETVRQFSEYSFGGLQCLRHINIPKNVNTIPQDCFRGCSGLRNIDLSNITRIENYAFLRCYKLKEIDLKQIAAIMVSAFEDCEGLENIKLKGRLNYIPTNCFKNCVNLKSVTLPENLLSIGDGAFENTHLPEIELPKKLRSIGSNSFFRTNIPKITLDRKITIQTNSFDGDTLVTYKDENKEQER